ncbi:MAG: hypothetical protein H6757_00045 [Candidatus Omnitrophica bacterium]|nr:hypothetical protein [Candidatus Omnitrophota bacterium]
MLKKWIISCFAILIALGAWACYRHHNPWLSKATVFFIEKNARDIFSEPLRLEGFHLDSQFRIHIQSIKGKLKTRDGSAPFELESFSSENSLLLLLQKKPVRFRFERLRPAGSTSRGIEGDLIYDPSGSGSISLKTDIHELLLEDLKPFNPENLTGASGTLRGYFAFFETFDMQKQSFKLELTASDAGGTLQARFFDVFLPYLPAIERKHMNQLLQANLVSYKQAALDMELLSKETMKVLLRILVPDYNLNLNLNAQIRLEEGNSFIQIAELLGFFEVKTS